MGTANPVCTLAATLSPKVRLACRSIGVSTGDNPSKCGFAFDQGWPKALGHVEVAHKKVAYWAGDHPSHCIGG